MASLRYREGDAIAALIICCRCRRLDLPCLLPPGSRTCTCCHSSKSRCRSSQRRDNTNRRFRARLASLRVATSAVLSALDSVDLISETADGMSLTSLVLVIFPFSLIVLCFLLSCSIGEDPVLPVSVDVTADGVAAAIGMYSCLRSCFIVC